MFVSTTRRSLRLYNREKDRKLVESQTAQNGSLLTPSPSISRGKELASSKRSTTVQDNSNRKKRGAPQPPQATKAKRRKLESEQSLQQQQQQPPPQSPVFHKFQEQTSNKRKREPADITNDRSQKENLSEPEPQSEKEKEQNSNKPKRKREPPDNTNDRAQKENPPKQKHEQSSNTRKRKQQPVDNTTDYSQKKNPPEPKQEQSINKRKRKRELRDDINDHSRKQNFPEPEPEPEQSSNTRKRKPQLPDDLRSKQPQQELQVAAPKVSITPRSPPATQEANNKKLDDTRGSAPVQPQEQQHAQSDRANEDEKEKENASVRKDPIAQWVDTGFWPDIAQKEPSDMADQNREGDAASVAAAKTIAPSTATGKTRSSAPTKKRGRESGAKVGTWECLYDNRVYKEESSELLESSFTACKTLLNGKEEPRIFPGYPKGKISRVLMNFQDDIETKLQIRIMPWVVPSAELLALQDLVKPNLFADEHNRDWACEVLGSSTPKPDYAVGLSHKVFTCQVKNILRLHKSRDTPFHVTPNLWFPFLIGEAKTSSTGLENADIQNIHSAAIAVKLIINLYEAAFGPEHPRVKELMCKILVFTISHDNNHAVIYGHFATRNPPPAEEASKKQKTSSTDQPPESQPQPETPNAKDSTENSVSGGDAEVPTEGETKIYFYRQLLETYNFDVRDGADRFKPYNFALNVYNNFGPEHRDRILTAANALKAPEKKPAKSRESASDVQPSDSISAVPSKILELQNKIDQMSKAREQERDEMRKEREQERADMKAEREQERADMKAEREQEQANMKAEREQEQANTKAEREQEQANMKAEREQEQANMKAEREQEQADMKAEREQEQADMKAEREQERAEFRAQFEQLRADSQRREEEARKEGKQQFNEFVAALKSRGNVPLTASQ